MLLQIRFMSKVFVDEIRAIAKKENWTVEEHSSIDSSIMVSEAPRFVILLKSACRAAVSKWRPELRDAASTLVVVMWPDFKNQAINDAITAIASSDPNFVAVGTIEK
jgi:hypothetical protein